MRTGRSICLLASCIFLLTCVGCTHRVSPVVDPSARLEERRERSVTEDPAVRGETPDGWLSPPVAKPADTGNSEHDGDPKGSEVSEFVDRLKNTQPPKIFQGDLAPGAKHTVDIQLSGPAGVVGTAQWVGSAAPMNVSISLNSSLLVAGKPYRLADNRGGAFLKAQASAAGQATMEISNPSTASVTVRIMLVTTSQ